MAYRRVVHGDDEVIALARPVALRAGEAGVRFRVGMETTFLGNGPMERKQTFNGTGVATVNGACEEACEPFTSIPAYAGIAVHDLTGRTGLS